MYLVGYSHPEPLPQAYDLTGSVYPRPLIYPQDLIVTRPHPNTLGYIYDARYNGTQGTAYMDVLLQAELTKRIRSFHLATVVSGPSTVPQQLFRDPNQIVVTRWGSIAPEAAALGIPSIFSALAPYASLFPEIYHASAVEALESRIHEIRKMISIGSPLQLPCLDAIALYRYRLSTREDGSELSPALACTDHFIEASQCELPLTGESLSASRNLHISRFHQLSAARTDRERALLKILLGLI